jgi:AraC-like DNA-binding protein
VVPVLNIGIILSFFLSLLLFSKKDKSLTDNILSLWLTVIGIHLTGYFLYHQGYWEVYPHLIGITVPFPFLYGPLLYLYVLYSIKGSSRLRMIDLLHFAPFLISYVYMIPFYFFYTAEEKIQVDKGLVDDYGIFTNIMLIGFLISGLSYSVVAYRKLMQHQKIIQENFSYSNRINLNWLRYAILGIGAVFVTAAIVSVLREVLDFQFPFNGDILFYSLVVAFVVYIGYSGIRQQNLFSNSITQEEELTNIASEYKRSGLKTDVAVSKHRELTDLMENEKLYLDPKLSLNMLSRKLAISSNHLSQIINQYEKVNFHDFVNSYRVEEFIQRAQSNKNFTLLAHALDSGFNSKSSFNSIFKKLKSQSPTQYMAGLNN